MSYDLFIECNSPLSISAIKSVPQAAERSFRIELEPGEDLFTHSGGLVIELKHGARKYDAFPEWSCEIRDAKTHVSLSMSSNDAEFALGWALAAAVASAGNGVVTDPQNEDGRGDTYTPEAAWTRALEELSVLSPKRISPEEAFIERLRSWNYSEAQVVAEVELWRKDQALKKLSKRFEPVLGDADKLTAQLKKAPVDAETLDFVFDLAWRTSHASAAALAVKHVAPEILQAHLLNAARMGGHRSRMYVGFLIAALPPIDPTVRAQMLSVADADMREVLAT